MGTNEHTEHNGLDFSSEARSGIEAVLEAVETLGEDLSLRAADGVSFQVKVPEDPPAVRILAELINELGASVTARHDRLSQEMQEKTRELSEAYNALQASSEEVRRELSMAHDIQERLIPGEPDFPQRDELRCSGFYQSMANIGGDLYDIVRIGRNAYGILMADVSGHGIPAALITALVKVAFQTRNVWGLGARKVCEAVNTELYPILNGLDYFVTAWYGILNLETSTLEYCNCGHHPGLLLRWGEAEPLTLETGGRFLGAFDDSRLDSATVALQPGDTIFLYTDGIIEARNFFDEEYGYDRMISCLMGMGGETVEGLIHRVRKEMNDFCMGADQRDDQSMFAVQFNGAASPLETDRQPGETASLHGACRDLPVQPASQVAPDGVPVGGKRRILPVSEIMKTMRQCLKRKEYERALGMCDVIMAAMPELASARRLHERLRTMLQL